MQFLKLLIVVLISAGFMFGCSKMNSPGASNNFSAFQTTKVFKRELFTTQEECVAVQKNNPLFNCSYSVTFETNGAVYLMYTDIMNQGTYVTNETEVTMNFRESGDAPTQLIFKIKSDSSLEDPDGKIWRLQ